MENKINNKDIGIFGLIMIVAMVSGLLGYFVGYVHSLPEKLNITIGMTDDMNKTLAYFQNYSVSNQCCYPQDCEQAKFNPANCTCEYLVKCFDDGIYAEVK